MKKLIPFSSLSKIQQRIEIAKDTIKWVKAGTFKPKAGRYLQMNFPVELQRKVDLYDPKVCNVELNKLMQENKKVTCNVCAKGGMFMAHVMKTNNFDVKDSLRDNDNVKMKRRLLKIFSLEQMDLVETAFERKYRFYDTHIPHIYRSACFLTPIEKKERKIGRDKAKTAIAFGRKHRTDSGRMIAIMENLIKNKGEFKP